MCMLVELVKSSQVVACPGTARYGEPWRGKVWRGRSGQGSVKHRA